MKNSTPNEENINEEEIKKILSNLINGATCLKEISPPIAAAKANLIYPKDKDSIDTNTIKDKKIMFEGSILSGGIYDIESGKYISDDNKISYTLDKDTLLVESICTKASFSITNFDISQKSFHLNLSKKPLKEVGIVIDVSKGMQKYIQPFLEIVPAFAKHIFKDEDSYAKLVMVSFVNYYIDICGVFHEKSDFIDTTKRLKLHLDSDTRSSYYAIVNAMSYFTKDNKLSKEIYLISSGGFTSPSSVDEVLRITKNINDNAVFNSKEKEKNMVKVHTFALDKDIDELKSLAQLTGGSYFYIRESYGFQKSLLTIANDGVFDINDLKGEFIPSKTQKLDDPDNPDNKSS